MIDIDVMVTRVVIVPPSPVVNDEDINVPRAPDIVDWNHLS